MIIGHYVAHWSKGGLENYVRRLASTHVEAGHTVRMLKLSGTPGIDGAGEVAVADDGPALAAAAQGLDVLHLHYAVAPEVYDVVPGIRTLHVHTSYCPSGKKFLARAGRPCDRPYNRLTCLASHVTQRCGSLKRANLRRLFGQTRHDYDARDRAYWHAISTFQVDWLRRTGYPEARTRLILHAGPAPRDVTPPPAEGLPRFAFVGRLSKVKGADWLLRALAHTTAPLHLDVVGDGELSGVLPTLAEELGITDRVTFHGWVEPGDVAGIVAQARAVLGPSLWPEPAGLTALEAGANGRAFVASAAGGFLDSVADGETGLLVPPGDDAALASALDQLANDYDFAVRLGKAGRERVAHGFRWSEHVAAIDALYAEAVEHHHADVNR
ncbi:MAG: glycosyltransferase family 4 protein [Bacteroidota bacterium]